MFKVKIGEDEYEVTFKHCIPSPEDRKLDAEEFRNDFGTLCEIYRILPDGSRKAIWGEWSDLSIKDQFNRNIGRKVALSKVLFYCRSNLIGGFSAEYRKLFWDAYYKARGNKW